MTNVLFISTISPYPKRAGKHIVWGGLLDYLRTAPDVRLSIASFAEIPATYGLDYTQLSKAGWKGILSGVLAGCLRGNPPPLQEVIFRSRTAAATLRELVASQKPDVIIFDTIRTQQYQEMIDVRDAFVCTFLDDLFSVRYAKAFEPESLKYGGDRHILGAFGQTLPKPLRRVFDRLRVCRRWLLNFERKAVRRSELRALEHSQLSLIVSTAEVQIARTLMPGSLVMELRPWLNKKAVARQWDGEPTFVFLGSLQLAHNVTGVLWFIQECMPALIRALPRCRIKIIGTGAPPEVVRAAQKFDDNILMLGFQENLDQHLSSACTLVAPLVFGSGVKIKMLDALCCGLPAVCTRYGAEGVHGGETPAISLAETPSDFVDAMMRLTIASENSTASLAAQDVYRRYYSTGAVRASFDQLLDITRSSSERH